MRIVVLPGDGIGPEVMAAALRLLDAVGEFDFVERLIGGASIDEYGEPLTDEVIETCKATGENQIQAVLLGAVGGPKWDSTRPGARRPEEGLLRLRKELGRGEGLYANLRPVRPLRALLDASPLRRERIEGTDLLIVRELIGGSYYGERGTKPNGKTYDTCEYSAKEIENVAHIAFGQAISRGEERDDRHPKVTSVDKANVMETSRLWRETVTHLHHEHYQDVALEHLLVDNAAAQLIARPFDFDVILTENTFGDILSDEAAMLTGSMGMLPSASIDHDPPGLFEPVHGSAPDIAGEGTANPLAMFLTVAMMMRIQLKQAGTAALIEQAVEDVLDAGLRTRDLVHDSNAVTARSAFDKHPISVVGTSEMTDAVIDAVHHRQHLIRDDVVVEASLSS